MKDFKSRSGNWFHHFFVNILQIFRKSKSLKVIAQSVKGKILGDNTRRMVEYTSQNLKSHFEHVKPNSSASESQIWLYQILNCIMTIKVLGQYAQGSYAQTEITPKEIKLFKANSSYFSGCYLKRLKYLLYGSVASLPSPSSNIEAWPYGTSLRFAPAFRALGVCVA